MRAGLERLQAGLGIDGGLEDLLRRAGGDLLDLDAALGTGHQHRHADGAIEHHADVNLAGDLRPLASTTSTFETFWPSSPVCLVTSGYLNMTSATLADVVAVGDELDAADSLPVGAAALEAALAAAAGVDLALSTTGPPPSWSNACCASAARGGTMPRGTAAPAAASSSFAWYS